MVDRRTRRTVLAGAAALPIALAAATAARAQPRTTALIVGSTAGGSTDTLARVLAKLMTAETGRSFVVDNKPGGGGNIAGGHVARSTPDGGTLLVTSTAHAVNATLYRKLPFDPLADFTPITLVARVPNVLVARRDAPYDTPAEFVAFARANPLKVNFAVAGQGSSIHLATEEFKLRTGIRTTDVPYKGTSVAITDIGAGAVDLMFAGMVSALPHVQAGRLKAIGVGTPARLAKLPNVPTLGESVPGFESTAWFGLFGPAQLDAKTVDTLWRAARDAMAKPEFTEFLEAEGGSRESLTPQAFDRFVRDEVVRWRDVITRAGLKLEG
jgi:tripartite-type tricarboxylate transporter receptor subunit TctC